MSRALGWPKKLVIMRTQFGSSSYVKNQAWANGRSQAEIERCTENFQGCGKATFPGLYLGPDHVGENSGSK